MIHLAYAVSEPCGPWGVDSDHQLLALWAASCAEHVLDLLESARA